MLSAIRNTFLTALALVASVVGVDWNRQALRHDLPAEVSGRVRSTLTSGLRNQIPLQLTVQEQTLHLGDRQTISVFTAPSATVELVLVYPDGRSDRPPTVRGQASETGQFRSTFQLSDWRQLGVFQVLVIAGSHPRQAKAKASFVLEPLKQRTGSLRSNSPNLFPLVP